MSSELIDCPYILSFSRYFFKLHIQAALFKLPFRVTWLPFQGTILTQIVQVTVLSSFIIPF